MVMDTLVRRSPAASKSCSRRSGCRRELTEKVNSRQSWTGVFFLTRRDGRRLHLREFHVQVAALQVRDKPHQLRLGTRQRFIGVLACEVFTEWNENITIFPAFLQVKNGRMPQQFTGAAEKSSTVEPGWRQSAAAVLPAHTHRP
jgi:hypothetical protein